MIKTCLPLLSQLWSDPTISKVSFGLRGTVRAAASASYSRQFGEKMANVERGTVVQLFSMGVCALACQEAKPHQCCSQIRGKCWVTSACLHARACLGASPPSLALAQGRELSCWLAGHCDCRLCGITRNHDEGRLIQDHYNYTTIIRVFNKMMDLRFIMEMAQETFGTT